MARRPLSDTEKETLRNTNDDNEESLVPWNQFEYVSRLMGRFTAYVESKSFGSN